MLRKLANGYRVIAEKPEKNPGQMTGTVVLALSEETGNYATWWHRDEDGATFQGVYFPTIAYGDRYEQFMAAVKGFSERTGY